MLCSQHCTWSVGDFHTRDDKKARPGVWLPPSHHLQRRWLPHSLWSMVAVQMSDREQHLGGGPARPEELNRAWCCVRASACHSNDFWLPVVTLVKLQCLLLGPPLPGSAFPWVELCREEELGEGVALCLSPLCVQPEQEARCLERCFGFNWQEEACEDLQISPCVMILWQCEVNLRAVTALLSCQQLRDFNSD